MKGSLHMSSVCLGTSEPYQLQRGLREGCPSSCMVYLMFHNAVLLDYVSHVDASGGSTVTFGTHGTSEVRPPTGASVYSCT